MCFSYGHVPDFLNDVEPVQRSLKPPSCLQSINVYDLPFHVRLNRFVKRDHPGTLTAADYRSFVEIPEDGDRVVQIYMNTPLRKDGFVMYQTSWGPQIAGRPDGGPPWYSVFEVAENPSDKWPEYSCWVIAIGLLIHFSMKLTRFLGSSTRRSYANG